MGLSRSCQLVKTERARRGLPRYGPRDDADGKRPCFWRIGGVVVFRSEGVVSGPGEGVDLGDRGDLGAVGGNGAAMSAGDGVGV